MFGDGDNDRLNGEGGSDTFVLSPGTDRINGGGGFDSFHASGRVFLFYEIDDTVETAVVNGRNVRIDLGAGTYAVQWLDKDSGAVRREDTGTLLSIERVHGGAGDDELRGSDGEGFVWPGGFVAGEWFAPEGGNDLILGGDGIDVLTYYYEYDTPAPRSNGIAVDFAAGSVNDGLGGRDIFFGIEKVEGSDFDDIFNGSDEDDHVIASRGIDAFDGGDGHDIIEFISGSATVDLQAGTATEIGGGTISLISVEEVWGFIDNDTLRGSEGDDVLRGDWGDDLLEGGDGDDILIGGRNRDDIDGGEGSDTLAFDDGPNRVAVFLSTGKYTDRFGHKNTVRNVENVLGTELADVIEGDGAKNVIAGRGGRDKLSGGGGKDTIYGGADDDRLRGGDKNDLLVGQGGRDRLFGGAGSDELLGGDEGDKISGNAGADIVMGGDGSDLIRDSEDDQDILRFLNYVRRADGSALTAAQGYKNINNLFGEDGNDRLLGTGLLDGGSGNDTLRGSGVLFGGEGDDLLAADAEHGDVDRDGAYADYAVFVGGKGFDTIIGAPRTSSDVEHSAYARVEYLYANRGIVADMEAGTVYVGRSDRDDLTNIRAIVGSDYDDRMTQGVSSIASLSGEGGDDKLTLFVTEGGTGATYDPHKSERALGGEGNDTIRVSGEGDAIVHGGNGNDRITAKGDGRYMLTGGDGNDKFFVQAGYSAIVVTGKGDDSVVLSGSPDESLGRSAYIWVDLGGLFDPDLESGGRDTVVLKHVNKVEVRASEAIDSTNIVTVKSIVEEGVVSFLGKKGTDIFRIKDADAKAVVSRFFESGDDRIEIASVLPRGVGTFSELLDHVEDKGTKADPFVEIAFRGDGGLKIWDLTSDDLTADMFDL